MKVGAQKAASYGFPFWMNLWYLWPVLIFLWSLGCIFCQVWGCMFIQTWLFVYVCLGDSLSPCFLLCRWFSVCLPWAVPFVLGPVDSLLSSNAPPLTGFILGPQKLCSRSATGSSKRLKALRSALWTHLLYLTISFIHKVKFWMKCLFCGTLLSTAHVWNM